MDHGRKILLKTFWCSKGWCYNDPTPEDYDLALEEGYFLPVRDPLPHNEAMTALRNKSAGIITNPRAAIGRPLFLAFSAPCDMIKEKRRKNHGLLGNRNQRQ